MKHWMKKHKDAIITIIITVTILIIGAFVTVPYENENRMTLSKMEKMVEKYPPVWVDGL